MNAQLHYLLDRQKQADLTRSAERARLAQGARAIESSSRRGGFIARLLLRRRLLVTGTATGAPATLACAAAGVEPVVCEQPPVSAPGGLERRERGKGRPKMR